MRVVMTSVRSWPHAAAMAAPRSMRTVALIPSAAGTTIDDLVRSAREYIAATGRRVTFAYALLDGVNDSVEQAREKPRGGAPLAGLRHGWQPV